MTTTNDELSAEVADAFLQIAHRQRQVLSRTLGRRGLNPGQAGCLKILEEHDGATQSELASAMHLTRPSVTRMLQRMERGGLVERRPDADDQRVTRVYVTGEGRDLMRSLHAGYADYVSRTVAQLPAADRAELARILHDWAALSQGDEEEQP